MDPNSPIGEMIKILRYDKKFALPEEIYDYIQIIRVNGINITLYRSRDKRVDVIGAICPAKFHDQLKQELRYIANITKTKMVILDDMFMCKLLKYKTN